MNSSPRYNAAQRPKFIETNDKAMAFSRRTQSVTPKMLSTFNTINTPRFTSPSKRAQTPHHVLASEELSPGPSDYETVVNSCWLAEHRKISFPKTKRFFNMNKPSATPQAGLYDTTPAVGLLLRRMARVKIAQAKREVSPHLSGSKYNGAILKGVYITKQF